MLVVISLLTAVMAFVGRMLFGLFQAEQVSARDVLLERRLSDLAIQFREDVYTAQTVTLAAGGTQLRCNGPANRQVTYTAAADRVDRAVSPGKPLPEKYSLPGGRPVFQQANDSAAVELLVTHSLPQLTYTPAATHSGGTIVVRAAPRRHGAEQKESSP